MPSNHVVCLRDDIDIRDEFQFAQFAVCGDFSLVSNCVGIQCFFFPLVHVF